MPDTVPDNGRTGGRERSGRIRGYAVVGMTLLWVIVLAAVSMLQDPGAIVGSLVLVAWIGLPVAAFYDIQYVRANTVRGPNAALWCLGMAIWVLNIAVALLYLHRRYSI